MSPILAFDKYHQVALFDAQGGQKNGDGVYRWADGSMCPRGSGQKRGAPKVASCGFSGISRGFC